MYVSIWYKQLEEKAVQILYPIFNWITGSKYLRGDKIFRNSK